MSGKVYAARFSQIPEALLDAPVSDRAYRVYGMLHRYSGTDGRAFPGRLKLADRLKCALSTLDVALRELEDTGFLWIEAEYREDGGRKSSNYHCLQGPNEAHPPPTHRSHPPPTHRWGYTDPPVTI